MFVWARFHFSWVDYLGVELLGHMVTVCNFLKNYQTALHRSCAVLHSSASVRIVASPHPPPALVTAHLSVHSHSHGHKAVPHHAFVTSLMTNDVVHLLLRSLAICISSSEESPQTICSFLHWVICLYIIEL